MRLLLVLAVLGLPWPAHAACHHYSRWYYPTPQPRCTTGIAAHTTREADHTWFVEIVLPDPDPERAAALEALRAKLDAEGSR